MPVEGIAASVIHSLLLEALPTKDSEDSEYTGIWSYAQTTLGIEKDSIPQTTLIAIAVEPLGANRAFKLPTTPTFFQEGEWMGFHTLSGTYNSSRLFDPPVQVILELYLRIPTASRLPLLTEMTLAGFSSMAVSAGSHVSPLGSRGLFVFSRTQSPMLLCHAPHRPYRNMVKQ